MVFTGTVANINAALNGLVFAPTADYNGAASVQITTDDQGSHGIGGPLTDTDTIAITINPVNDAPVLSGTNNLSAINEDNFTSTGILVSGLLSGHVSEVDAGPLSGIAVTAVDNSNGTWQYTTDGGSNWNNFGTPSAASARLLTDNANTRVRFVPNANYNGTVSGITFRAWDQTSGTAGFNCGRDEQRRHHRIQRRDRYGVDHRQRRQRRAGQHRSPARRPPTKTRTSSSPAATAIRSPSPTSDVNEGTGIVRLTLTATNGVLDAQRLHRPVIRHRRWHRRRDDDVHRHAREREQRAQRAHVRARRRTTTVPRAFKSI
jgi:hypothetical protein